MQYKSTTIMETPLAAVPLYDRNKNMFWWFVVFLLRWMYECKIYVLKHTPNFMKHMLDKKAFPCLQKLTYYS